MVHPVMEVAKIILILWLGAMATAYSIDSLRDLMGELIEENGLEKKEFTFRDFLDGLEEPDPVIRSKRVLCESCPSPTFPSNNSKCDAGRWRPEYVKQDDGCDCLSTYKCCNKECQPVDVKACWENGGKGLKYGSLDTDCCDCQVVKCVDCKSTTTEDKICPRGEGAKPADCYKYTQSYEEDKTTGCWSSHCEAKSSDASNSTCLLDCQSNKMVTTHCQFPQNDCENQKELKDCPKKDLATATSKLKKPLKCYKPPVQSDDVPSGQYYNDVKETCGKCKKWTYEEKSCQAKNNMAEIEDCHKSGENLMDKKCFKKDVTQDDCGCNQAQCLASSDPEPEVFDPENECPKNHVKITGASLCMKKRDLCKKCPDITPMTPADCPNGKIVAEKDCNGCKIEKCEEPRIPTEKCDCLNYLFDKDTKSLSCNCGAEASTCAALKREAAKSPSRRFHEFNGKCYLFASDLQSMRWQKGNEKARGYCQGLGADLVAVETRAEYQFINRAIKQDKIPGWNKYWILGGKRTGVGNKFIWVQTGKPIEYNDWARRTNGWSPVSTRNKENAYVIMFLGKDWYANESFSQKSIKMYSIICEGSQNQP